LAANSLSSEEIKQVFQALSFERDRVRQLSEELDALRQEVEIGKQNLPASRLSSEMLGQFKQLLKAFKQKQAEAAEEAANRIHADKDLNAANEKITHLTEELGKAARMIAEMQYLEGDAKRAMEQRAETDIALESVKLQHAASVREKEGEHEALLESRQHAEQLERAVQVLRQKSDESQLETEQLQQELQSFQNELEQRGREHAAFTAHVESLMVQISKEQRDKQEVMDELRSVEEQFQGLHHHMRILQQKHESQSLELEALKRALQDSHEAKEQLQQQFDDKNLVLRSLESDITSVKQSLVRGLREAKELESRYLESVKEKVDAISKNGQMQSVIDKQRQEIERLKTQCRRLGDSEKENKQLFDRELLEKKTAFEQLVVRLENSDAERLKYENQLTAKQEELSKILTERDDHRLNREKTENEHQKCEKQTIEKDNRIKELIERLTRVDDERTHYKDELKAYQNALDERSAQFAEAQQHLAKKVREGALFESKIDELKEQLNISGSCIEAAEKRNNDLQDQLKEYLEEKELLKKEIKTLEEKSQDQEKRSTRFISESHVAQQKIKELEVIQERYQQLQAMLSNFGSVLGVSMAPTEPQKVVLTEKLKFGLIDDDKSIVIEDREKQNSETRHPYQGLFSMPARNSSSEKQDLFE
jgi:chromosome segregation ATPase